MSSTRRSTGLDSHPDRHTDSATDGDHALGLHRRERIVPEDRAAERRHGAQERAEQTGERLEEREVVVQDPALSPETNAALTEELRDVVGADRVTVPADRPRATEGEFPDRQAAGASVRGHRFAIIRTTAIVVTFAAIVALATNRWWLLPLAVGVHALGTMTVVLTVLRLTTEIEHPSPEVAAALSEEGVASPDARFTHMVEEFTQTPRGGVSETVSPGFNARSTSAGDDTPTASAEQSTAMTPTAGPSRAGGAGGAPDAIIFATAFSLFVLSVVLPITSGGGALWLLPAVMVPLLVGWLFIQVEMAKHEGQVLVHGRKAIVTITSLTAIAVAVLVGVVAIAFTG